MSSVCAPGTRSQGESTHQLGKSRQWTSCETQRRKTKVVCGILSSCASRSGGEGLTNNYMEGDKLMGFQYLTWPQKIRKENFAKESAENPVVRISDVTESDSSLKNWKRPHLACSSFTLFSLKCLLWMIMSNITFIFISHKFALN